MNVRGERIIVFGDSLSHPGMDSGPTITDITYGSNRTTSAPGDLLASLLLEQGAQAVRVNARVGRSAVNFWNREDVVSLLASDQLFRPTKVIVMLGTNDNGLAASTDKIAFEKIRDAYKGMGAEVWAVGPFVSAQNIAKTNEVIRTMSNVFGGRFVDGRPISALAEHSGDGVHYTATGARTLAYALTDALMNKISPTWIWTGVAIGAGILGAVVLGSLLAKRSRRDDSLLGDGELGDLGVVDIVNGKRHRGSTSELIRAGFVQVPCASGLDKGSGQARCWGKKPIDVAGVELSGPSDHNYRVRYRLVTRDGTVGALVDHNYDRALTLAEAEKLRKMAKRKGYDTPWIETVDGEFVPVTGAKRDPKLPPAKAGDVHWTLTNTPPKDKPRRADDYVEGSQQAIFEETQAAVDDAQRQADEYEAQTARIKAKRKAKLEGNEHDEAIAYAVKDSASRAPKFGRKVMISDAYEQIVEDGRDDGMSFEEFKRELVRLHKSGAIELSRADLVAAMDPNKVAKSETDAGGATFHFVNLAGPRTRGKKTKALASADDDDDEDAGSDNWFERLQKKHAERKRPMRDALTKHDAVFVTASNGRRVLLLKSKEVADVEQGAVRVTEFDEDGPVGHKTKWTIDDIADELTSDWNPKMIEPATEAEIMEFTSTERFAKGAANVIAVQKHNAGNA